MSFNSLLIHSCTIRRKSEGAKDSHGQPAITWNDLATLVNCRLNWKEGAEEFEGKIVSVTRYWMFLPRSQDIREADRVTAIVEKQTGAVVDSGTFHVTHVRRYGGRKREHHREIRLKRITGTEH